MNIGGATTHESYQTIVKELISVIEIKRSCLVRREGSSAGSNNFEIILNYETTNVLKYERRFNNVRFKYSQGQLKRIPYLHLIIVGSYVFTGKS